MDSCPSARQLGLCLAMSLSTLISGEIDEMVESFSSLEYELVEVSISCAQTRASCLAISTKYFGSRARRRIVQLPRCAHEEFVLGNLPHVL
jgi:hypothetical protein